MTRAGEAVLRRRAGAIAVAGMLSVSGMLQAQGKQIQASLYEKVNLGVSLTGVILNSDIRVDGRNGNGTNLDAETDLGLATVKLQPRFDVRWRPGHRHELEVGYQFARRSGVKTLDRDITFRDSVYHLGGRVNSQLDTDEAFLIYRFAFLAKPRSQVGLSIGTGAIFLDTKLQLLTSGGGAQFTQSEVFTGPVGSIGLYGRFLSGERWSEEIEARYLGASVDRFDAKVGAANVAVRYQAETYVKFELGWGLTAIKVDVAPASNGTGFASGQIKYSLQNVRFSVIYIP